MRLKQVNSSNNNVSSPDENSSNYSFNGRENSNSTFDIQQFRTLLDQRLNELKLNPANTTQSTIQMSKGSSRVNNLPFNLYNPQLMELIRNGGDLNSISNLMNSLANNSCGSPSSSNQEEYSYQDDDTLLEDEDEVANEHNDANNFQSSIDLSVNSNGSLKSRQKLQQHLLRRNNSEDEMYNSDNEDDLQTGDLDDEISNDFENNHSMMDEKRSKLMLANSSTTSRRKTAQPQYVNPNKDNLEDLDKPLVDKQPKEIEEQIDQ